MKMMSNSQHSVVEIVIRSVPFTTTLIPIIILHVLNITNLRKGISNSSISVSKTMSTVLAVIICIYLLTNIPGVILSILKLYEIKFSSVGLYTSVGFLTILLIRLFTFCVQRQLGQFLQTRLHANTFAIKPNAFLSKMQSMH